MATATAAIKMIETDIDGVDRDELSDIDLMSAILDERQEKLTHAGRLKRLEATLVERLKHDGVTEREIGEKLVLIAPKMLTRYDGTTLKSLKPCGIGEDELWDVFIKFPNSKQLNDISEKHGASAKAVIASAKKRDETDTTVLKIKKPSKKKRRY
jgi:hypothetical protein